MPRYAVTLKANTGEFFPDWYDVAAESLDEARARIEKQVRRQIELGRDFTPSWQRRLKAGFSVVPASEDPTHADRVRDLREVAAYTINALRSLRR